MTQIVRGLSEVFAFVHLMTPAGDIRVSKGQDPTSIKSSFERSSANPYRNYARFGKLRRKYAKVRLVMHREKYAAVLGVDPEGLCHAFAMNKHIRKPLVYASFELLFQNEVFSDQEKNLKDKELRASREVALVLVQDELRERLLRENCEFTKASFCHCPVAPWPESLRKSDFLRRELGIPAGKRIVLVAGHLHPFSSRDLLHEMVSHWRDPYHLVVHSRFDLTKRERMFLERLCSSTGRVSITQGSVALGNLTEIFCSADFALLPYCPEPSHWMSYQNIYNIGMSSGKAAYAAMCGLPMIASALPTYSQLFDEVKCGAVYSRVGEIPNLLDLLDSNYSFHSREARRFYDELLNPTEGIARFCQEVVKLANQ